MKGVGNAALASLLLGLLGPDGRQLLLAASPRGLLASLSVQEVVPPAEAGSVVANELLVVRVVVVSSGPDGQEVSQTPGEVVARVGINGLEQTQNDPHVHGDQMKVAGQRNPEDRAANSSNGEQHNLDGRGIFSSETERRRVGVVQLVDVLVKRAVVKGAVEPVVPGILHDEENGDLVGHLEPRWKGHTVVHTEKSGNRVEQPNLRKLNCDMADEDEGGAVELFSPGGDFLLLRTWFVSSCSSSEPNMESEKGADRPGSTYVLDLVLVEGGNSVDDNPWQAASEVDNLVHHERHDASGEGIILHIQIPGGPGALENAEVDIDLGNLLEDGVVLRGRKGGRRV